jgi:glycogen debranching enzyme
MAAPVVAKDGELFVVCDARLDITPGEPGAGLYFRDMRHLSALSLALDESPLTLLDLGTDAVEHQAVYLTNAAAIPAAGGELPAGALLVLRERRLGERLSERVTMTNHARAAARVRLRLSAAADFRDMFDIRGFYHDHAGRTIVPQRAADGWALGFDGGSGTAYRTRVGTTPAPTELLLGDDGTTTSVHALEIAGGASATVEYVVVPWVKPPVGSSERPRRPAHGDTPRTHIVTSNPLFNAVLARSLADLHALWTPMPGGGDIIAAGIPWYVAAFGRDGLIVARQLLPFNPAVAAGTLRFLASVQGQVADPWREEQPGKIVHEMRFGEQSRRNVLPFSRYYGTVDATALFLLVLADYLDWTGDRALFDELRPHVVAALGWLDGPADSNGDGLIDYTPRHEKGLVNQNWKDSNDSVQHVDGHPVVSPIAPVDVQGYVYAAKSRLAACVERFGDAGWAVQLRSEAEQLRAAVETAFWSDELAYYVDVVDGSGRQTGAVGSNPAHLLASGTPSDERAALVAERLLAPDMFSGWGVRTLSSAMPQYHPVSYHNGSVWPHDNGFALWGLRRYRRFAELDRLTTALFDAATRFPLYRLPELFCGFPRGADPHDRPVAYPTTCSPQAWAAGTPLIIAETLLGLHVDPDSGELTLDPWLPEWLDWVELRGIVAGGRAYDVRVAGKHDQATVDVRRDARMDGL